MGRSCKMRLKIYSFPTSEASYGLIIRAKGCFRVREKDLTARFIEE